MLDHSITSKLTINVLTHRRGGKIFVLYYKTDKVKLTPPPPPQITGKHVKCNHLGNTQMCLLWVEDMHGL